MWLFQDEIKAILKDIFSQNCFLDHSFDLFILNKNLNCVFGDGLGQRASLHVNQFFQEEYFSVSEATIPRYSSK